MTFTRSVVAALVWSACATPLSAESVTLFRLFLNDGTAVVSYGEYARVGDRVVFSMPIGAVGSGAAQRPEVHVVNLPASAVNWIATTKYAESARFSHYVATRAEADYAALAGEVAATLNAIVFASDAKARLAMALDARRRLATWPRDHYGYRADDVREMLGLLDDAIAGLRVAAGETSFVIDLVATDVMPLERQEYVPLLREPTAVEAIEHAAAVARITDNPIERVSILRGVIASVDKSRASLPPAWAKATRASTLRAINEEVRLGRRYAALTSRLIKQATAAAKRGNVRAVEGSVASALRQDARLGGRRPDDVRALLERLQGELDAARRLRLARDRWQERAGIYRGYSAVVMPIVETLTRARRDLDDIKRLSGSDAAVLVRLGERLAASTKTLGVVSVPDELQAAHALLASAVNLAEAAVLTRRRATVSGDLALAWDASAAASGSLTLLERARQDMDAAIRFPETR